MSDTTNGWSVASPFVAEQLKRLADGQDRMAEDISTLKTDVAVLKDARSTSHDFHLNSLSNKAILWAACLSGFGALLAVILPALGV